MDIYRGMWSLRGFVVNDGDFRVCVPYFFPSFWLLVEEDGEGESKSTRTY